MADSAPDNADPSDAVALKGAAESTPVDESAAATVVEDTGPAAAAPDNVNALETGASVQAGSDVEAPVRRPSARHHASAGTIVDRRYRVGDMIARGSWSVVYDAEHLRTGQQVALKMLLADLPCGDEAAEARFFREARTTAALEHPNTVRVFDVGRTDAGALYFASERLRGHTLEEELEGMSKRGERMCEDEALDVAEQVLRSLKEAHGKGLIHRDLKPANIFCAEVAGETMIKVLDFGIARLLGQRITQRGITLGSPDFMSPEQCACQDVDARSDFYALAAMMFMFVTGRAPFVGDDAWEVIDQHRSADIPDPRKHTKQELSESFAHLVMRGLSKHPGARWQDADMMLAAIADTRSRAAQMRKGAVRRPSSASIAMPQRSRPRVSTGQWGAGDRGAQATAAAPQVTDVPVGTVATTAKYSAVTEAALAANASKGPVLEAPPAEAKPDTATNAPTAQNGTSGAYRAVAIGLLLVALGLAGLLLFTRLG